MATFFMQNSCQDIFTNSISKLPKTKLRFKHLPVVKVEVRVFDIKGRRTMLTHYDPDASQSIGVSSLKDVSPQSLTSRAASLT